MTEEIAFSDWSKRLEHADHSNDLNDENGSEAAANSWLPAYGFHQPAVLQQAFLQNKTVEFYNNEMMDNSCANHLLLETIMEETSDDLRSETSESEYNSGLLTDSVSTIIHVPPITRINSSQGRGSYWNGRYAEINTDPGVQDDEDEDDFTDDDDNSNDLEDDDSEEDSDVNHIESGFPSRTNSLLQFENLEKHYESIYKTQRTNSEPFGMSNSYENKRARSWYFRSNSQPENLNNLRDIDDDNDSSSFSSSCSSSSSDVISSDEVLSSSYSSTKYDSLSRKLSLRSFRSVDSLTSLHQKQEKEQDLFHSADLSQSLTDNISKLNEQTDEIPTPAKGIYKTSECLNEMSDEIYCGETECNVPKEESVEKERTKSRSTENLSEDSGFGDHITKDSSSSITIKKILKPNVVEIEYCDIEKGLDVNVSVTTTTITSVCTTTTTNNSISSSQNEMREIKDSLEIGRYDEEQETDAKFSSNSWQSDPNLLDRTYVIQNENYTNVDCDVKQKQLEDSSSVAMASRLSVASTPNLFNTNEEYHYKGSDVTDFPYSNCNDSTVSLSRVYSLKRINFTGESQLSCGSSKGSNIQIMTSFVNLTNTNSNSNKGVHFCPIVSEVNWQDSYSTENDSTSPSESENDDENMGNSEDEENVGEKNYFDSTNERSPFINTIKEERYEKEMSPTIDELVQKLLPESASSSESEKEKLRRAQQRARLDLITSPPPKRGSVAHVMQHTTDTINKSSSQLTSANSYGSTALVNAMNSNAIENVVVDGSCTTIKEKSKSSVGKLGGFFQRFSLKRLSGRKNKNKKSIAPPVVVGCVPKQNASSTCFEGEQSNSRIIPLSDEGNADQDVVQEVVSSKPPLPPLAPARRRPSGDSSDPAPLRPLTNLTAVEQYSQQHGGDSNTPTMLRKTPCIDPNTGIGLLETDIDSNVTLSNNNVNNNSPNNKKSRSLLNLDNGRMSTKQLTPVDRAKTTSPHHNCNDYRAKSMEFLLDKENQAAVKAPENELQKGNGERKMSEHELRVQRSLQKLNVPEWYKNSSVPAQGFLLKRHSDVGQNVSTHQRWNTNTLPSKTTSLSSLGSNLSTAPRSPTCSTVTSPGPTHYTFSRWSTSRLNSGTNSSNTSPCGSARSSFNYRQPYLGWRSQEKLSKPRTPAERLAAGLLPQRNQTGSQHSSPSLTEVRSSIKEVTSAIVHYVSGTRDSSDRLSPSLKFYTDSSSRSTSPRGSTGRLCWLESSFVGTRPSNLPETPSTVSENKIQSDKLKKDSTDEIYLNYSANNSQKYCENQTYNNRINGSETTIKKLYDEYNNVPQIKQPNKQNSDTATLDDILDSLLGLSSSSRTPSPAKTSLESELVDSPVNMVEYPRKGYGDNVDNTNNDAANIFNLVHSNNTTTMQFQYDVKRRRSEGNEIFTYNKGSVHRLSYDVHNNSTKISNAVAPSSFQIVVQCKYPKCGKTAEPSEAKRTFKICHNCDYLYCSRECRRLHWEKHRKACLLYRVGELCRRVLHTIKQNESLLSQASIMARRGFLENGRGSVKFYFHSPQMAEQFINSNAYPEAVYIKWTDLMPYEMDNESYAELLRICKSYNPDTRLVLLVAVHVVSEVPTSGTVKWERQIISKFIKTKLSPELIIRNQPSDNISKDSNKPQTLILTSLPGVQGTRKDREVNFTNIQRQLRQRGVSLRKQFPDVYNKLCNYVEGKENFIPTTIYPIDALSGKNFMCVIMPEAEPEKLDLLSKENSDIQTIDISKSSNSSCSEKEREKKINKNE